MSETQHKDCYGTMFPDALHFRTNEPQVGKVFMYELEGTVGMGAGRSSRKFAANTEEWDDCVKCPEFEHCYKLCIGKLTLEAAIANE